MVKVCVTGCLHGELDRVYADIAAAEQHGQFKTDLVLCCGDFQALRNPSDLAAMSVPPKYYSMGDFWRYYSEEIRAPILTLFVGGNHEASSYLQELPYGGWVAPNIWYMGYAGVVQFMGLRIAGLSGIYKQHDYTMGHYEHPPYSEATKRSVYHLRNLEVFRLGQIRRRLDIVLSHDWPRGIYHYGDAKQLVYQKPHFRNEIETDTLGSPPGEQLFCHLKPRYWFAAHLHCKFAAMVEHKNSQKRVSCFLALDKCLPKRGYLQFIDVEPETSVNTNLALISDELDPETPIIVGHSTPDQTADASPTNDNTDRKPDSSPSLFLDPEWLCILKSTNHLMSTSKVPCILPDREANERCDFSASVEEIKALLEPFGGEFAVPDNFERTAPVYKPSDNSKTDLVNSTPRSLAQQLASSKKQQIFSNPQTELLCAMLDLMNPNAVLLGKQSYSLHELSAQLVSRAAEEEEDDEEDSANENETGDEVDEDDEPEVNEPQASQSWVSSSVPEEQSEYDPLNSTFMSPVAAAPDQANHYAQLPNVLLSESLVSQNPEELLLETNTDDEDEVS